AGWHGGRAAAVPLGGGYGIRWLSGSDAVAATAIWRDCREINGMTKEYDQRQGSRTALTLKTPIFLLLVTVMTTATPSTQASDVAKEWQAYLDSLALADERRSPLLEDVDDPQLREEFYRGLFALISASYHGMVQADRDHPEFWPLSNNTYNFFSM